MSAWCASRIQKGRARPVMLDTGSRRVRQRYREAAAARHRDLERALRGRRCRNPVAAHGSQPLLRPGTLLSGPRGPARASGSVNPHCDLAPPSRILLCVACVCGLYATSCSRSEEKPAVVGPVHSRAAWVLVGSAPRIGDVAVLDAVVSTPPDFRVGALAPPTEVPGFQWIGSDEVRIEKSSGRWIHRTRNRLRALDVGRFEWPAASIEIAAPGGDTLRLTLEAIPLEVRSVLKDHPGRHTPYGVVEAPERAVSEEFGRGVVAGSLGALALAGIVWVGHRIRSRSSAATPGQAAAGSRRSPSWVEAREGLARARAIADPRKSAQVTATHLRHYMVRRFGAQTLPLTTEELAAAMPPLGATSRWPEFVAILRELDALRFRPEAERQTAEARRTVCNLLTRAEAFVVDSTPPPERTRWTDNRAAPRSERDGAEDAK